MKESIRVERSRETLTLINGVTYSRVPAWFGQTRQDLKLDIVMPKHVDGHAPLPAIVWCCGGSFSVMDRSIWLPQMMELAYRGFIVACADYRTSNCAPFPAPVTDVKAAIRFLRANAAEFCVDPERIAVLGESAGGALASFAGLTGGCPQFESEAWTGVSSRVQAVVDYYGVTDIFPRSDPAEQLNIYEWEKTAFLGGETPEHFARASVLNYVTPDAPPFLILHGSNDETVPVSHSQRLYEALLSVGAHAEFCVLEGAMHGDDLFYQPQVFDRVEAFLRKATPQ